MSSSMMIRVCTLVSTLKVVQPMLIKFTQLQVLAAHPIEMRKRRYLLRRWLRCLSQTTQHPAWRRSSWVSLVEPRKWTARPSLKWLKILRFSTKPSLLQILILSSLRWRTRQPERSQLLNLFQVLSTVQLKRRSPSMLCKIRSCQWVDQCSQEPKPTMSSSTTTKVSTLVSMPMEGQPQSTPAGEPSQISLNFATGQVPMSEASRKPLIENHSKLYETFISLYEKQSKGKC